MFLTFYFSVPLRRSQRINKDYCWRAVAGQPTILYNSEIWPKSIECKIVDLRSRMRTLYPSTCGFGDMRNPFLYVRDMLLNVRGNIDRFRATAVIKDTLNEVSFYIDVCCLGLLNQVLAFVTFFS